MGSFSKGSDHQLQIDRAFTYLKKHLNEKVSLNAIATESGLSPYHFIRVFHSYTGETPFTYLRRERIAFSLKELHETDSPIIDIAHKTGFETSSSFNKAFKKITTINPTEFRNMGKDLRVKFIYDLSLSQRTKEIIMNFDMNLIPEVITRNKTTVYTSTAQGGDFKVVAPQAWENFLKVLGTINEELDQSEFFGIGTMTTEGSKKVCTYKAALSLPKNPNAYIEGLTKEELPSAKYAKFLLKGPYDNLWLAFDKAFQIVTESSHEFSEGPCLENYLNDPQITPPEELLTEILIPIK